ncbi:MAG TPA: DUF167 family protein [Dehalococcoidia bacterium]
MEGRIRVRVTPRAGRDRVDGWDGELLRVRVAAPPAEGRANRALVALLAAALDVPSGAVRVIAGERSREKLVAVRGLTTAEVRRRLTPGSGPPPG